MNEESRMEEADVENANDLESRKEEADVEDSNDSVDSVGWHRRKE